jgi:putative transcriptional regulator
MAIVRHTLDPNNPRGFTDEELARLDAKTDEELDAAAESDPDNPPFTEEELQIIDDAMFVRAVRKHTGLTQEKFAEAYQINTARLRDLEQGRTRPDSALRAYLTLIVRRPDVRATLAEGPLRLAEARVAPAGSAS